MGKKSSRYKKMQHYMTYTLLADLTLFILYWISAGCGVMWAKVVTAILSIAVSGLCLCFLFLSKELLRPRSLWMTATAGGILICLLLSLLLNFPSPSPYKDVAQEKDTALCCTSQIL